MYILVYLGRTAGLSTSHTKNTNLETRSLGLNSPSALVCQILGEFCNPKQVRYASGSIFLSHGTWVITPDPLCCMGSSSPCLPTVPPPCPRGGTRRGVRSPGSTQVQASLFLPCWQCFSKWMTPHPALWLVLKSPILSLSCSQVFAILDFRK